jgi:hypothetical protein
MALVILHVLLHSMLCPLLFVRAIEVRHCLLWHVDPLLGNDCEISDYTIVVAT